SGAVAGRVSLSCCLRPPLWASTPAYTGGASGWHWTGSPVGPRRDWQPTWRRFLGGALGRAGAARGLLLRLAPSALCLLCLPGRPLGWPARSTSPRYRPPGWLCWSPRHRRPVSAGFFFRCALPFPAPARPGTKPEYPCERGRMNYPDRRSDWSVRAAVPGGKERMAEIVNCPSCRRRLQAPEGILGHDVQCPSCGATFVASLRGPGIVRESPRPLEPEPPRHRDEHDLPGPRAGHGRILDDYGLPSDDDDRS